MQVSQTITPEDYFRCGTQCVIIEQFKHLNGYGMYCYPKSNFFDDKLSSDYTIAIFKVRRKPITNQ